jgi:hypothetical protein
MALPTKLEVPPELPAIIAELDEFRSTWRRHNIKASRLDAIRAATAAQNVAAYVSGNSFSSLNRA